MTLQQQFQNTKRFVDTLSYLKPVQIYARLWHKAKWIPISQLNLPRLKKINTHNWQLPPGRRRSQLSDSEFTFLNETHDLNEIGWDDENVAKLWRYNLHYFDDLNARDASVRKAIHAATIERWIHENLPFKGVGWESYPLSLRIVNWLKWHHTGNVLSEKAQKNLALQARQLHSRYEIHLQGNHLFANAKAMFFAGLSFNGDEAGRWHKKAVTVLLEQLEEQILEDGGHFELSPMYHLIILEDCLDLLNLLQTSDATSSQLKTTLLNKIPLMLNWLKMMCHPDGEVSFFNDAAMGIAPAPKKIFDYARRFNIKTVEHSNQETVYLSASGYVRMCKADISLIADVGKVGPEYLAGHAHADTLSFELSVGDERFIVNSGTSLYGTCAERQRQRGTQAHSTVCMGGQNSSDIWHGFRTGKRAYPQNVKLIQSDVSVLEAEHNGYAPFIHNRKWCLSDGELTIEDGGLSNEVRSFSRLHLHPDIHATCKENTFQCRSPKGAVLEIEVDTGIPELVSSTWHPEFGRSIPNRCIQIELMKGMAKIRMRWQRGKQE